MQKNLCYQVKHFCKIILLGQQITFLRFQKKYVLRKFNFWNNQTLKKSIDLINVNKTSIYFQKKVNTNINSKCMMANLLILRVVILTCMFLGELLAIIAIFENKWQKYALKGHSNVLVLNAGLWEYCMTEYQTLFYQHNQKETTCKSVSYFLTELNELNSMNLLITKENIKKNEGNYFFI